MGLLEYQAMPSLRHVARDGVLSTSSNRSAPDRGASGSVLQGRWHGPSITYKKHTSRVTLLQPARRAAVLGQPSTIRPHSLLPSNVSQLITHSAIPTILVLLLSETTSIRPYEISSGPVLYYLRN